MKKSVPMFYDDRTHLTFDDVCLVDGLSQVNSRSDVDISVDLPKGHVLDLPLMTAAMDTITSGPMGNSILKAGGCIVHHRNQSIQKRGELLRLNENLRGINGVAIGLNADEPDVKYLIDAGADLVALELAHAYMDKTADKIREIGQLCQEEDVLLMVGNFSSPEAGKWLYHEVGYLVDMIKVSQGGGSCCTTRLVTGIGKPTLQAVMDITRAEDVPYRVVADGGIKTSGDVAKSLGAGACAAMVGGMLSGTKECPGSLIEKDGKKYKQFRGMASSDAKKDNELTDVGSHEAPKNVEGVSTLTPYKGPVGDVLEQVKNGLQSSVASCGFSSLDGFREEVQFIRVSKASQIEAHPHATLQDSSD